MTAEAKRAVNPGVGMPAGLKLDEFGSHLWAVFGKPAYHVGSSLFGKQWRDVDVRMILADEEWTAWGLGDPRSDHLNERWNALVLAFSALGREMTGLPIDFQIQQATFANAKYPEARSALGMVPLRMGNYSESNPPMRFAPAVCATCGGSRPVAEWWHDCPGAEMGPKGIAP